MHATQFRTEFVRQSQATIMPRVTMTQFIFVIVALVAGIGLLGLPWWLAPLFVAAGYLAAYEHRGEMLYKRTLATATVQLRHLAGRPRLVNLQSRWETMNAERISK